MAFFALGNNIRAKINGFTIKEGYIITSSL